MPKGVKIVLVVAAAVTVAGLCLGFVGYLLGGGRQPLLTWRDGGLRQISWSGIADGGANHEGSEELEAFSRVDLNLDLYEVVFQEGDRFQLEYAYQREDAEPVWRVENGTLTVENRFKNRRYPRNQGKPDRLVVSWPKGTKLESLAAAVDLGRLEVRSPQADLLQLSLDMGDLVCDNGTVGQLTADVDMGNLEFTAITAEKLECDVDMGQLTLTDLTAGSLKADVDAGGIELTRVAAGAAEPNSGEPPAHRTADGGRGRRRGGPPGDLPGGDDRPVRPGRRYPDHLPAGGPVRVRAVGRSGQRLCRQQQVRKVGPGGGGTEPH